MSMGRGCTTTFLFALVTMRNVAEITLTGKDPADVRADALIVGVVNDNGTPKLAGQTLPKSVAKSLNASLEALGATGEIDNTVRIPSPEGVNAQITVLTGIGSDEDDTESLRRGAGAALQNADGFDRVALALPANTGKKVGAIAEGALLGAYRFQTYRAGDADNTPRSPKALELVVPSTREKTTRSAVERARIIAESVNGTRDLINTAPNDLPPAEFADRAKSSVKGTGLKIDVLDEKQLKADGYGGLTGVGQGSSRPPRLVKISWSPSKKAPHIALVGKGITFDSGGLSIKPSSGMETMKSDMSGAAAVLQTIVAAARLEVPVRVTAWLALAENMPSGTAQRPSDVISIYGGKTVEVLNTDAEGRLVLADALVAAQEDGADAVIDIATLTGAQMVALGSRVAGIMGTDKLRDEVVSSADSSGELAWPMPLPEEMRPTLKSKVADIANIGQRWGGMLSAAVFLKEFIPETPWAHIDIAGPSFNEGSNWGYTPAGGTGYGVRTMLEFLENYSTK